MSEKRLFERASFDGEVDVEVEGRSFHARVHDLSVGGLYILSQERLAFGQAVRVHIKLPALAERRILSGIVRWTREDGFGVQLGPTGALDTYALAEFVARKNQML